MVLVKARVRIEGLKRHYSSIALVDTGARMTLIDEDLASKLGVQYTGRKLTFISISGHKLPALEAIVPALEVEDVLLRLKVAAVTKLPDNVKKALRESQVDENLIVGLLTLERANMVPDTTTGALRKIEAFII